MMTLSLTNQKSFEQIVKCNQKSLKRFMSIFLNKYYNKVETTKDYIIAHGDIPIGLVAHLDTVFKDLPKEIFYDKNKNVMWSPQGLGADDRAGVYAIIKIVEEGYRPHVILTTDEEIGGIGADCLVEKHPNIPFNELKYLIQLDRRGANDCVFYDCYNPSFSEYIEAFDFVTAWGSFSDISTICPAWNVCGVNLSIGYEDEHQKIERLYIGHMFNTIKKVKKMLDVPQEEIPTYTPTFISSYGYGYGYSNYDFYDDYYYGSKYGKAYEKPVEKMKCHCCGKETTDYVPLQISISKRGFCCYECLHKVAWCEECGESFVPDNSNNNHFCYSCRKYFGSLLDANKKDTNKKDKGAKVINVRKDV